MMKRTTSVAEIVIKESRALSPLPNNMPLPNATSN